MKKIILTGLAISLTTTLMAQKIGPIETKYNQINISAKGAENIQLLHRVEKKLDIILNKMIEDERKQIAREEKIDSTIEKTKTSLKKGLSWISDKTKEISQ